MNEPAPVRMGDALDWLHEQGKRRDRTAPEFDVEETVRKLRAASDADAYAIAQSQSARAHRRRSPVGVSRTTGEVPELTRRELDVLTSLCTPALREDAFAAPATAREIAADLVVTEATVKQHLLRLYRKFRIPEGPNRRTHLANIVIALGLVVLDPM